MSNIKQNILQHETEKWHVKTSRRPQQNLMQSDFKKKHFSLIILETHNRAHMSSIFYLEKHTFCSIKNIIL